MSYKQWENDLRNVNMSIIRDFYRKLEWKLEWVESKMLSFLEERHTKGDT